MIHLFFPTKKQQLPLKHKKKHTSHFPVSFEPWNLRRFQPTLAPSSPTWLCAIFKVRRVEFEAKAVDKACEIENDVRWMRCWKGKFHVSNKITKNWLERWWIKIDLVKLIYHRSTYSNAITNMSWCHYSARSSLQNPDSCKGNLGLDYSSIILLKYHNRRDFLEKHKPPFEKSETYSDSWWKKSQTTTWDGAKTR